MFEQRYYLLGLVYAKITLAVYRNNRFCMDKTESSGFSGEGIAMIEMRVNKDLNQQSGNTIKRRHDRSFLNLDNNSIVLLYVPCVLKS